MSNFAENKKARFNYEILEELEAGVVLTGAEVKSIRAGHISLKEAYATVRNGEIWLAGAHISPYKPAHQPEYEPTKARKLLLKKSEATHLASKSGEQGLALVPLRIYPAHGKIKVAIALARGKKKYDKRESLKKKDVERDIKNSLKELR